MTRGHKIAIGGATVLVALLVIGWLELPGWLAERTVEALGITCVPLSIEVTSDLSHASIARTECSVPQGPIASFTLSSGAEIDLRGGRPTAVRIPMMAVNPRWLETSAVATALLVSGDTPDPIRRALELLARASTRSDVPSVRVDEIDIGRGEVLELHHFELQPHADGLSVSIASSGPPPYHGRFVDLIMTVEDIAVQATASTASITGHFEVQANIASFPFTRSIAFRLNGIALDGEQATYDLWIEPSPAVDWLREHASEILARVQAMGGGADPMHEQIEDAGAARRERLDQLSGRLQERVDEAHAREAPTTP